METKAIQEERKSPAPMPDGTQKSKPMPDGKQTKRAVPKTGTPENTILLGDALIEIKPTKLKYQRNRTAMLYKLLEIYPLADILAMEAGTLGDDRDGDKAVFDWLVAVFDDEEMVRNHYDDMDTEIIERLLSIYKRVNKVDEKDARQKKIQTADSRSTEPSR